MKANCTSMFRLPGLRSGLRSVADPLVGRVCRSVADQPKSELRHVAPLLVLSAERLCASRSASSSQAPREVSPRE
jgi:hypothetical protein